MLPVELGWSVNGTTGWGLYGLHLALGLARQGRRVHAQISHWQGIPATLQPSLAAMQDAGNMAERRIRFDPWGNHCPSFQDMPNRYRVLLAVFEDTEAIVPETMNRYDLVLAPSRWIQGLLEAKGVQSTLFHQGYDDSLFFPAPMRRFDGRFMIFSGGKLEFRKGQDIVVEAFRRFRETLEGKDAVLVTAWQNPWPQTMMSIWESGYVKGVPTIKGTSLDISGWLEINGIPRANHIDLGTLTQAEMANAIRECDVGLFPNRAEGATNLIAVETQALGVPIIASANTGHLELFPARFLLSQPQVTLPCQLYRGMDGWGESSPDECVKMLATAKSWPAITAITPMGTTEGWSWRERTQELDHLLIERVDA